MLAEIVYRSARDVEERETCVRLQHETFRPDEPDAPARYRAYVEEDSTYEPGQTRVAVADDLIVGHLRVWDRALNVRGVRLRAGGIGSLLCRPDYRGRGVASGLLTDADSYFVEAGYDFGLLFSIIGTPYYDARGWTPLKLPIFTLQGQSGGDLRVDEPDVSDDVNEIAALYDAHAARYTGGCSRHDGFYSDGPARLRGVFPRGCVRRDGMVVAYVNWVDEGERVWVTEACAWHTDDYPALAGAVIAAAGGKPIEGSLPIDHAFVGALETAAGANAAWSTHDEMMVKICDWVRLRDRLRSGVLDPGDPAPADRTEADGFWRILLGVATEADKQTRWWERMGPSPPLFYWWNDIF